LYRERRPAMSGPREERPMTHAIRIDRFGGPEVLSYRPVEVGEPGEGQARIRHTAIGVNMVDT
jgi:NADPH2:quinone reductase